MHRFALCLAPRFPGRWGAAMEGNVRQSHLGTLSPQRIERPACPTCGITMMLACIEPDKPGHDRRTFECFECKYIRNSLRASDRRRFDLAQSTASAGGIADTAAGVLPV
jgi:hypothetical protein